MWPGLIWTLGLCLRPLLLVVSGPGGGCGEARVCKSSLWSSADGQEVNRILCIPKWTLCLDSRMVPRDLSGLCIYSPTLSSMCPSLCSIQESEEWLLVAEILRLESNH